MEHRGKNSKGNEDEVKAEIGSNKSWNREYEKVKPTCGNCGKSMTRQKIRVHEMQCCLALCTLRVFDGAEHFCKMQSWILEAGGWV